MNRHGIALLATLWLISALSVVAGGAILLARLEHGAAMNRIALARGRWAVEGCLALLLQEGAAGPLSPTLDSTDLGGGIWCRATVQDPGAFIGLDAANADELAALVGTPDRAAALLDWLDTDTVPREQGAEGDWYRANSLRPPRNGPMASVAELRLVRGFDSATVTRLTPFLTARRTRRVNVNVAPPQVLLTLPGLDPSAVALILQHRDGGQPFQDLDGLLSILPTNLRAMAAARYAELQGAVEFAPEHLVIHLEGHVPEASIVTRMTVEVAPTSGRIAILAQEGM